MGRLLVGCRNTSVNHTDDIYLRVTTIIKRDIATLFRALHDNTVLVCTPPTTPRAAALYSRNKKKTTHCNDALGRDLICEKEHETEKLRRHSSTTKS